MSHFQGVLNHCGEGAQRAESGSKRREEDRAFHLLVHSYRSLIRLPHTALFARALRFAHSFTRSLSPELMGKRFSTHSGATLKRAEKSALGFPMFLNAFSHHYAIMRGCIRPSIHLFVLHTQVEIAKTAYLKQSMSCKRYRT